MDARHFDTFSRALSGGGSRRGLLATLPLLGGLFALLDVDETDARRRRKRRKTRHQHRKGDGKQNRKGKRKDNNKAKGSDDPCDGIACPGCETCQDGTCSSSCDGAGCCALDTCLAGTDASACGTGGAACVACSGTTPICAAGSCVACSATNPCPGGLCCAGGQCVASCPACQTCTSGHCQAVPNNTVACDGSPLEDEGSGVFCTTNTATGICVDGACSCPSQVYDPTNSNRCLCNEAFVRVCADFGCCTVLTVCTEITGPGTGVTCVCP